MITTILRCLPRSIRNVFLFNRRQNLAAKARRGDMMDKRYNKLGLTIIVREFYFYEKPQFGFILYEDERGYRGLDLWVGRKLITIKRDMSWPTRNI